MAPTALADRPWPYISFRDLRNINFLGLLRRFLRRKPLGALPAGVAAPQITLKNLDGRVMSLGNALKKGPVLVAFFKYNCLTSQFTFPFLERIYKMYGDSNFTLWGISQNHPADTREFIAKFGITFPILLDGEGFPVSNAYGLTNSPTLFLISPDSKIRISCVGFSKADLEAMAAEAAQASARPVAPLFRSEDNVPLIKPG